MTCDVVHVTGEVTVRSPILAFSPSLKLQKKSSRNLQSRCFKASLCAKNVADKVFEGMFFFAQSLSGSMNPDERSYKTMPDSKDCSGLPPPSELILFSYFFQPPSSELHIFGAAVMQM